MFVLRTGLQGNSKTLNTIKEVDTKAAKEGRTVYYHNIREFKADHPAIKAQWIEFDHPQEWFKLPKNSIIVIDEAQTFFRTRPQGSKVPEYASALETMRHSGHEVHAITQSPTLIDHHMRDLCNCHIHYFRGGGGPVVKRFEFQKVQMDVNKKYVFPDGETTRITIDKTYFGCYKSVADGAEHHFKFKPPKALFVLVIVVGVVGYLGYGVYERRIAAHEASIEPPAGAEAVMPQTAPQAVPAADVAPVLTAQEYLDLRTPRVPDVPSSAPIYDELTKPVTYPKPFCLSSRDEELVRRNALKMELGYRSGRLYGCRCNSQQGTRMLISFDACMNYVENGAFDPAIPDRVVGAGGFGPGEGRAGTIPQAPTARPVESVSQARVTVVPDTSRLPRTL
ncbi:zonular occludens toxin domain-containing protein [Pseudomonas aeruginosa]|nr:zonular occludens toxin domain-containing protein [Pseudomonas aeruginosa]WOU25453.1 zonular occludens toxin domain-containing protein [Pseudomonas aeruginosa]WOU25463.1 zonular occludens toxin domain-containing protein [Pseudomonas aeruginosa]WOU25473.1 zonular occludens toxin domain-containing protein [Pseudomonas aeruginosa]WOU25483.1 zonular occludens toxin domain-containing protein [Pseudomonas aeruginosa]